MYGVMVFANNYEQFHAKFPKAQLLNVYGTFVKQGAGVFFIEIAKKDLSLEFMQKIVDGLIERVIVKDYNFIPKHFPNEQRKELSIDLWVNEEGLFRDDFDFNFAKPKNFPQMIKGDMFVSYGDEDGETQPIHVDDAKMIASEFFQYRIM